MYALQQETFRFIRKINSSNINRVINRSIDRRLISVSNRHEIRLPLAAFAHSETNFFFTLTGAGAPEAADCPRALQCGALLPRAGQHILGSQLSQSESLRDPAGSGQKRRLRRGAEQYSAHRNDSHSKFTTQDGKLSRLCDGTVAYFSPI